MGATGRFAQRQNDRFDHNMRAAFVYEAVGLWLATRLQLLSSVVLGGAALLCVILDNGGDGDGTSKAAVAGLALTFAPMLTDNLNSACQFLSIPLAAPPRHACFIASLPPLLAALASWYSPTESNPA